MSTRSDKRNGEFEFFAVEYPRPPNEGGYRDESLETLVARLLIEAWRKERKDTNGDSQGESDGA